MIDKIIRFLYYSLFFATPLVMFSSTSELFEFNKIIFIYLVAIFIFFAWILQSYKEKKFTFSSSILSAPILLFLLTQTLSTLFSIDRHTSFFGYYGRFNGGLLSIITYVFLFFGLINFSKVVDKIKLLKISLTSSLLVILWGLPGRFGYDLTCWMFTGQLSNDCWTEQFRPQERMFSTLGQPNWLGAFLAINFFIGLYFFLEKIVKKELPNKERNQKIFYAVYLVVSFASILFTRSRSALLSAILGLFLFAAILFLKNFKKQDLLKKISYGLFPVLVGLLLSVLIFKTGIGSFDKFIAFNKAKAPQSNKVTTLETSSDVTESFDIRKIVWKGAIDLGLRYPLFGTGVETFAYSYYFVRPQEHNLTSEWDFLYNKAHNEYLNYFATTGFIGTASYLLLITVILFLFIRKIFKRDDQEFLHLALLMSYLAILITNFFGFSTTTINLFFYLLPLYVIDVKQKTIKLSDLKNKAFLASGTVISFLLLVFLIRYYSADLKYAKSLSYSRIGDYQTSYILLSQALKLKNEHVYEDKLSYSLANLAFLASYQKDDKLARNLVDASVFYNDDSLRRSPKNILYWKTKAKDDYLFYQIKLDTKWLMAGLDSLEEAKKISPTDPKIPYTTSLFYSLLADDEKNSLRKNDFQRRALDEVEKSIELKPDYRDAYLLKAQLLKKYGDTGGAKKTLEFILNKINPRDKEVEDELKGL